MTTTPKILRFDDIDWVDETVNPSAPAELVAEAQRRGAGRKRLAVGEGGFWCEYTTMPEGYHVPPHSHDQNELLIVLSGGCKVWPDGADGPSVDLGPKDSVILAANHEYSFTCGPDGMDFYVLRPGASTAAFDSA